MSYQPQFPGLFSTDQGAVAAHAHQEHPGLPATQKQMHYAEALSAKIGIELPKGIANDRSALAAWIDTHNPNPSKAVLQIIRRLNRSPLLNGLRGSSTGKFRSNVSATKS